MRIFLVFITIFSTCCSGFANTKQATEKNLYPAMTEQMRVKIADMHQQMATCLKAGKTFEDCHSDMSKSCREFSQLKPMRGTEALQQQELMLKGGRKAMTGYPGMMNAFCESKWLPSSESKESKVQK